MKKILINLIFIASCTTLMAQTDKTYELEEALNNGNKVYELNLYENDFKSWNLNLNLFPNLTHLSLTIEDDSVLLKNVIRHLVNLNSSQLTSLQLDARYFRIPVDIGKLNGLKELSITSITGYFPSAVLRLSNLTYLKIFGYIEHGIPEEIGLLTNLEVLDLYQTSITSMPSTIGNLTKLRILKLNENQISALPESVGNLKNLEELILTSNVALLSFPRSMQQLKSLIKIDIRGCLLLSATEIEFINKALPQFKGEISTSYY